VEQRNKPEKAHVAFGTWIYLKEPPEAVKRALETLGMPQYPDGRTHQYDPNEDAMGATESSGP